LTGHHNRISNLGDNLQFYLIIIIKTSLTSNLIIDDFITFEDYCITNLSSPENEAVIIIINNNDPVVFNTKITAEYALIYDILMKEGQYSSKRIIE
jgi:hypothetical protein